MTPEAPIHCTINGRFLSQPQTGVQRYAREITKAIDARLVADEAMSRRFQVEILLPRDAREMPGLERVAQRRSRHGRGYAWEQMVLPFEARGIVVSLANLGPLAARDQVLCIHDANVYHEPSSYSRAFRLAYRALLPRLARHVRSLTTVSSFSATSLVAHGVTTNLPSVVWNGHEHALAWNGTRSRFSETRAFSRPFVFTLGSRAKHKQLDRLLGLAPALDALGLDLVVAGGTSGIFADAQLRPAANVKMLGFVRDDDLAALLNRALCFAFPSRTEGFGIPLLEAMVHGAPIIASDCASMPEVCGAAALYAPPDDSEAWLAQIARLAADESLRTSLKAAGRARVTRFSWRQAAERYLELVAALAHKDLAQGRRASPPRLDPLVP